MWDSIESREGWWCFGLLTLIWGNFYFCLRLILQLVLVLVILNCCFYCQLSSTYNMWIWWHSSFIWSDSTYLYRPRWCEAHLRALWRYGLSLSLSLYFISSHGCGFQWISCTWQNSYFIMTLPWFRYKIL